jgi:MFS family permease
MRRFDYSWVILATGFLVLFFSGGSRFAFGLMLKPMAEELEWTRSSLSLAVTAFMVVSAVALPFIGRLVDRYSLRLVIAASAVLAAFGIGLMGRVNAHWQVFVLYGLIYAIGNAGTSIAPVGVMISRWFPRRRGVATSTAIAGSAMGQLVIVTALASALSALGWRTSYTLLGALNLAVVAPLVLLTVRELARPQLQEQSDAQVIGVALNTPPLTLDQLLRSRQLWLLVIIYGVCGFHDFFVVTHVAAFASDQGVGDVLAGNLLALMGLMGLIGVLASGVLADAFGAGLPTGLCFLLRIALFGLVIYFQDTAGIVVFALGYGFTFLITAPLTVVFAANIFGTARLGTVSGIISMVHNVTGGLGAFVGAFIFDEFGSYDWAFVLMLGLAVVSATATVLLREKPLAPVIAR